MIPLHVIGVGMHQRAKWTPIDDEPGDEGSKLCGREDVHFKHGHGMGPDGSIEELVDSEFRDWMAVSVNIPLCGPSV